MARTTHDPVLTADARSARIADAPIEGAATQTGAGLLDRSCAAHIAPQLRALVVPIDCVELHPRNPRRGAVAAVAASLARFGQVKPIVVQQSTGYVIAGNHVLRAALSLDWTEIAANVEDLDDADAMALMLADNRTADLGGYDDTLLAAILAEQQAEDNLAATGYDADDVAALLAQAGVIEERDLDAAPDLPAETDLYVKRGQTWTLGRHTLVCGDSTVAGDVRRLLGDEVVDLLWSDPPYGCQIRGRTKKALTIVNDDLGPDGTRALVAAALRLAPLRPGGAFYVAAPSGPELHLAFLLALGDAGLTAHQTLVWVKDRFAWGSETRFALGSPGTIGRCGISSTSPSGPSSVCSSVVVDLTGTAAPRTSRSSSSAVSYACCIGQRADRSSGPSTGSCSRRRVGRSRVTAGSPSSSPRRPSSAGTASW